MASLQQLSEKFQMQESQGSEKHCELKEDETFQATMLDCCKISPKLWTMAFEQGTQGQPVSPSKSSTRTTFTISRPPCLLRMVQSLLKPRPNSSTGSSLQHFANNGTPDVSICSEATLRHWDWQCHQDAPREQSTKHRWYNRQDAESSCALIKATLPTHMEEVGAQWMEGGCYPLLLQDQGWLT